MSRKICRSSMTWRQHLPGRAESSSSATAAFHARSPGWSSFGVDSPARCHSGNHSIFPFCLFRNHRHAIQQILHGDDTLGFPGGGLVAKSIEVGLIHFGVFMQRPIITSDGGLTTEAACWFGPLPPAPKVNTGLVVIYSQHRITHCFSEDDTCLGPGFFVVAFPFRSPLF